MISLPFMSGNEFQKCFWGGSKLKILANILQYDNKDQQV
jgi:hypothetical protein